MAQLDVFALPSYESARLPDAWPYIASTLTRRDLTTLALVSRKLQGIAQALLWAEPRRYWRGDEENVVDDLHYFMEAIEFSRSSGGKAYLYTQTLDLSHLGSDSLSFSFSRGWASRLLSGLPALRSFIVSYTEAFDHDSVAVSPAKYEQLRLLSIHSCPNFTPASFRTLLTSAANLYYLEVASCPRLRNDRVVEAIAGLSKLGVVKLPGSCWSDQDILTLTRTVIENRANADNPYPQDIRSLDLSGNHFSDEVVQNLKFLGEALPSTDEPPPYEADDLDDIESGALISSPENGWSAFFEPRLAQALEKPGFSDARSNVIKEVRHPGFQSPVEAGELGRGLTHLNLSGTSLTASAVAALIRALPLEDLKCGDLSPAGAGTTDTTAIPAAISSARTLLDAISDSTTLQCLEVGYELVTGFIGCQQEQPVPESSNQDLPPYPYAWLRHQGTQWDPMIIRGLPVKMYQFSPALLALKKLTLTSIPESAPSTTMVSCIEAFTQAAGEMQEMVSQYWVRRGGRPTGRGHLPPPSGSLNELELKVLSSERPKDQYDADTEAYLEAGMKDFSFFPDEKESTAKAIVVGRVPASGMVRNSSSAHVDIASALKPLALRQDQKLSNLQSRDHENRLAWTGKLSISRMYTSN